MLPSSKDSTPESQVLAASFSCRLLMISWSSEPELLCWRGNIAQERERPKEVKRKIQRSEVTGGRQSRKAETNSRLEQKYRYSQIKILKQESTEHLC